MGELYDCCKRIQDHIDRNNLDQFKARGELALRCGFLITLVKPEDSDDPAKIGALRDAARDVFGLSI
ncbi:MAG: hypothetical protein HY876_10055 [Coriobacteriales bacterium]|nr:hypothetical protein [Coriobacteriales bacterium]